MSWRRLVIAGSVLALGCAGAGPAPDDGRAHQTAASTPTVGGAQLELFETALRDARFSFVDPATLEIHTASGPYRLVAARPDGVEFAGYDDAYRTTSLTLFLDEDRIWARVLISGREFLTRIR